MKIPPRILIMACVWLQCLIGARVISQTVPQPVADAWLPAAVYPDFLTARKWSAAESGTLTNEVLVGKLRVYWHPPADVETSSARLWASADAPGRWQARDWQPLVMERRGARWEIALPVQNVDVPVIYFVEAGTSPVRLTAMRVCLPRLAGLEEPSRVFWPFLEGFEEELWSWRTVTDQPGRSPVETAATVKNGNAALRLSIPSGKRSTAVTTTRVRGWQLEQSFARGIRLWVRTASGTAKVRCSLQAHAFTSRQVTYPYPEEPVIGPRWQPVDLMLDRFPALAVGEVDLMSVEVIGSGPLECFVDDVQLLGRWRTVD